MKTVKIIFIVLLIIIIIPLIVALFVPKESNSEGQVVINRSHQEVFDYIKLVKNQDNFGVWHLSRKSGSQQNTCKMGYFMGNALSMEFNELVL